MTLVEPSWHEAQRAAHAAGQRLPVERLGLERAHDRMCAHDLAALTPLPPVPISAMDGWAVRGDGPWQVTGSLHAGQVWSGDLRTGEAVTIATGAALPVGADAVLRSEDGVESADGRVRGRARPGDHIRPAGEEARRDDVLVPAGERLTPARIGLLAAAGHDEVDVVRQPTVALLVFGDELLAAGLATRGRVRDSLGPQVPGWLARLGVDLQRSFRVEDTLSAHVAALDACRDVDLVITTGGTAHGPVDHLHAAVAATEGEVLVDAVACQPGHPMLLAGWGTGRRLVGLPGNPLAAIVALLTLGQPLVRAMGGGLLPDLPQAQLGAAITTRGDRTRLVPSRVDHGRVVPVEYIGSGMLRGLAAADGLVVVPPQQGQEGNLVEWVRLP